MARFLLPSTAALVIASALGASVPDGTWPTSQGNVSYSEVYVIAAGETFDGSMKTYDRSDITCEGQTESGTSTAVFSLEAGATLKNAIIGTNQMEGVHCDDSDCTIENVWWEDVCEDALSIKGGSADSVSTVTGGGARYADDKVIQHNGYGSVVIDGFYAQEFGKLYRSCGTCGDRQRYVNVSNVYAVDPDVSIVTVNENYGDEAILKNIYISASDDGYVICGWSEGTDGDEPTSLGDGIKDPLCQYSDSDIHINEAVPSSSSSGSTSTSTTTATTAASTTSSSANSADAGSVETTISASDDSDLIAYTTTPSSVASSTDASATSAAASSTGSDAASSTEASSAEEATSSYTDDVSTSSYTEDASTTSYTEDASTSSYAEDASTTSSTSSYSEETASLTSTSAEETASSSSASETEEPSSSASTAEDASETESSTAAEADDMTATSSSAETTATTSKCSVRRHRHRQ
jgi:hypothetical protein